MNWSELSDAEIAEYLAYSALGDVRNISNSVLNILHTADTILFAEKKGNTITVTCEKQKNAEEFKPIKVTLLPAHDSCIAAPCNRGTHAASVCKSHLRSTLETLAESGEKGLGWTEWLKATGKPEG